MVESRTIAMPPSPDRIERRLRLTAGQLAGVMAIALLPVLAVCGVFGASSGVAVATAVGLELTVEYPRRLRMNVEQFVRITVRNRSDATLDEIRIELDNDYLDAFSDLRFNPPPGVVDIRRHVLTLHGIAPGRERVVSIEVRANRAWLHRGSVVAEAGSAPAGVDISTLVFP